MYGADGDEEAICGHRALQAYTGADDELQAQTIASVTALTGKTKHLSPFDVANVINQSGGRGEISPSYSSQAGVQGYVKAHRLGQTFILGGDAPGLDEGHMVVGFADECGNISLFDPKSGPISVEQSSARIKNSQ